MGVDFMVRVLDFFFTSNNLSKGGSVGQRMKMGRFPCKTGDPYLTQGWVIKVGHRWVSVPKCHETAT